MIIKRIIVKGFRAIRELTSLDLFPGLNIVKGDDNEAGKSSLRMAITRTLFQDPAVKPEDLHALTSWGANEPWAVTLEFEAEGNTYRISRSFKDNTCELVSTGSQEYIARIKESIAEKMAELTGCPTGTFFESTACIGQEEFIRIIPENARNNPDNPVGTITKRLQARLSGVEGTDIPVLLANLYAKTHNRNTMGPYFYIQRIAEQTADLRGKRLEQDLKVNGILEKRRLLAQTRLELGQINRSLPDKLDLLGKNRQAQVVQKEIAGGKARYDVFQKARGLKAELDRLNKEIEPIAHFTNAEEKVRKIEDARSRLDYLDRQRPLSKDELGKLEKQKPALWILAAGAVLIVGGLAGLLANPFLWTVSIVGILFATYWLISYRAIEKQRKAAIQKLSRLNIEMENTREEVRQLLNEFHCESYADLQKCLAEYQSKTGLRRDVINRMEALTEGKEWPRFVEENRDASARVDAWLKELQELEPFNLEPQHLQQLENEVENLQRHKDQLEQEIGALEKFFQYTRTDRDHLIEIEEELSELEQQRKYCERKRKVYELTREILGQAYKQTLSLAADLMEVEISRSMALITEGRYNQVKIMEKENDLTIQTFSPEMKDWVDVDRLSRATQDQFYICARLALAKLIMEGKKPVILLDDPFVNFHARRLKKMMTVLQDIAKGGYQILLFTCSDAYDYLGKVVTIE